jgi:hypothetical protein
MTRDEYNQQVQQWANLNTSSWNDDLLKAAAAKNANWTDLYTGSANLGGTTLSGSDAKLVSQYFAAKGYSRNEEWISSNQDSYWMRQLRDAQNWAMQNDKTQGMYKAELQNKDVLAKQNEANIFRSGIESQQNELLSKLQEAYNTNNLAQQDSLQKALAELRESQDNASRAASEQEVRRMEAERTRTLEQGRQNVLNTASRGLMGTDADRYQGETQQYGTQADFIRNQLTSAGLDTGFLSKYDISEQSSKANQLFDTYESTRQKAPDTLIQEYGSGTEAQMALEKLYSQAQTGILDYDSQVRNNLSQLHSLYSSFNKLGDINTAQGGTAQERVASLFGLNKVDTSQAQRQFGSQQDAYNKQLNDLAMLTSADYAQEYRTPFDVLSQGFDPQIQRINELYQTGANKLHGLFGDAEAMSSGRAFNEASRKQGLLSTEATKLGSTLSQAANLGTNLMSKYNETANSLRTSRTNERSTYYANEAQRRFNESQASKISSYSQNIGKQLSRGQRPETDVDAQLNRYSLFN